MAFVLASSSPRRKVLLASIMDEFVVEPVDIDEVAPRGLSIPEGVRSIARKKALAASVTAPDDFCLAADTVVSFAETLLNKARSKQDARTHLATLAGSTHQVSTGVALAWQESIVDSFHQVSHVTMDRLPIAVFDTYIEEEQWVGKAGAYGIQDPLLAPFCHVEGSWSNVVGLPVAETHKMLGKHGIATLPLRGEDILRGLDFSLGE